MSLKETLAKRREKRLERLEERDAQRREDRKNGVKLPAKIVRKFKRMSMPKRIGVCVLVVVIIVGACGGAYFYVKMKKFAPIDSRKDIKAGMDMQNMVVATGTTTVGMTEETFDVSSLETELEIEEVYLNSGEEVEKGAPILKISEESLNAARTELEQAQKSAEYSYRLGVVDHEESLITAKSILDQAAVKSSYADNDYRNDIQEKAEKVEDLKKQVEDAQDLVDEYTKSVEEDYYYTYYDVENLEKEVSENFDLLMKLYEDWDIERMSQSITQTDKYKFYEDFAKEVEEESEEYDTAVENYKDAKQKAETNLNKEKANLEALKAQLTEAQVDYDKAVSEANSTKTETVAQSSIAEDTYNTSVEKADEDLATLKDALDDATDNLTAFNESISDGYMYTSTAGTVMMVAVSEGSNLSANSMVMAYTDESTISVSASVSQDDIAKLAVGDKATVMFEEEGNYDGTVMSINPNTASNSKSSVTYTVTVELSGDVSALSQNMTATVIFGDMANFPGFGDNNGNDGPPSGEDFPDGAPDFDGEMPDFNGEMPSFDGEKPDFGGEMPSFDGAPSFGGEMTGGDPGSGQDDNS